MVLQANDKLNMADWTKLLRSQPNQRHFFLCANLLCILNNTVSDQIILCYFSFDGKFFIVSPGSFLYRGKMGQFTVMLVCIRHAEY